MKVILRKDLNCFRPVCDQGEQTLRRMAPGQLVMVNFTFPRNVGHHRKFFAMLDIVLKNQEHFKSTDQLLDALKIAIGHTTTVKVKRGTFEIPKSISFAKMDQAQFDNFYKRAVDFVLAEVIPGLGRDELEREVMQFA
ncbi:MAG: DUF1367 family protein [Rhodocyclaceae bacterium]|nr:DUF1367 family protein [Rhodocyclaceae bacterium]